MMQCPPCNSSLPRPKCLPLPPHPVASLECLLERLDRIYRLLRRRGFSDAAALVGRDMALAAGMKALATGEASRMSAERRAGWLWKLARRAAYRAARREIPSVCLNCDPPDHCWTGDDDEPRLALTVRRAMARLTEKQRTSVVLSYIHGLTRAEAASEMRITTATVCCHLKAAFARLRKELAALEPSLIPGENRTQR